jgi:hypothetical protein
MYRLAVEGAPHLLYSWYWAERPKGLPDQEAHLEVARQIITLYQGFEGLPELKALPDTTPVGVIRLSRHTEPTEVSRLALGDLRAAVARNPVMPGIPRRIRAAMCVFEADDGKGWVWWVNADHKGRAALKKDALRAAESALVAVGVTA